MVTLPYIRGITECVQRAMQKHHINTPIKPLPHLRLQQVLVHPKDQIDTEKKCDVIYEIPCLSCNNRYIGETGRMFGIRKKEHQKECENVKKKHLERWPVLSNRKQNRRIWNLPFQITVSGRITSWTGIKPRSSRQQIIPMDREGSWYLEEGPQDYELGRGSIPAVSHLGLHHATHTCAPGCLMVHWTDHP